MTVTLYPDPFCIPLWQLDVLANVVESLHDTMLSTTKSIQNFKVFFIVLLFL